MLCMWMLIHYAAELLFYSLSVVDLFVFDIIPSVSKLGYIQCSPRHCDYLAWDLVHVTIHSLSGLSLPLPPLEPLPIVDDLPTHVYKTLWGGGRGCIISTMCSVNKLVLSLLLNFVGWGGGVELSDKLVDCFWVKNQS
mgnify:CR=1 FL=1